MKKERYLEHSTTTQREKSRDERNYDVGDSSHGFIVGPNQGQSPCLQKGELTCLYMSRGRIATDQQFCEFPVLCLFNGVICNQYPTSVKLLRPSRIPEGNTMQLPPLIFFLIPLLFWNTLLRLPWMKENVEEKAEPSASCS